MAASLAGCAPTSPPNPNTGNVTGTWKGESRLGSESVAIQVDALLKQDDPVNGAQVTGHIGAVDPATGKLGDCGLLTGELIEDGLLCFADSGLKIESRGRWITLPV